ncbi:MAG: helix-turn-helix domain-containing protein [Pseudonocardiaceae bacterium]
MTSPRSRPLRGEPAIGERIRELHRPLYTQIDLAVAADVSVDVIRKLEQGWRLIASIPTLQRIAQVLGVGVADLLDGARLAAASQGIRGWRRSLMRSPRSMTSSVLLPMTRCPP